MHPRSGTEIQLPSGADANACCTHKDRLRCPAGCCYFFPGSGRGGGVVLAAAPPFAAVFVAFGFLASRFDFCSPFAITALLVSCFSLH